MKIVVDGFGGDHSPEEIVLGVIDYLIESSKTEIILTGDQHRINEILKQNNFNSSRLTIINTTEVISNSDSPVFAVRNKKDSSMTVALDILKSDGVEAFVTAGPTGAALSGAFMKLGRIKGISRPALASILPTKIGTNCILCDCGANVDSKPINLHHFAIMAHYFAKFYLGIDKPRIGLLSNGSEKEKGNLLNKEVYKILEEDKKLNFIGNCEARELLSGDCDVIVTDGFAGNVALKTAEGIADAVFTKFKFTLKKKATWFQKLGAYLTKGLFKKLKNSMDYNSIGGACLLGVSKIVIKSHGSSKRLAIKNSIFQAETLAGVNLCEKIHSGIVEYGL